MKARIQSSKSSRWSKKHWKKVNFQFKTQFISSQIIIFMRLKNEDFILIIRDVYNAKQIIRHNTLSVLTFIQYFLRHLKRDNWYFWYQTTKINKEMTHLFFVKKHTSQLLKNNYEILFMNCIYKINRYKFSLLIIMRHSCRKIVFYVKFAFIATKKKDDFVWILRAFNDYLNQKNILIFNVLITNRNMDLISVSKKIFSAAHHLFCIWHVNKNVLIHCKFFSSTIEAWESFFDVRQTVIYVYIRKIFDVSWSKLKNDYYVKYTDFIDYLNAIWIRFYRGQIIQCYINKIQHFFITATFRSKEAHRILKHNLRFSVRAVPRHSSHLV